MTTNFDTNTFTLDRDEYTKKEYIEIYQAACKHYDYKLRTESGWIFFSFVTDYRTYKNQK